MRQQQSLATIKAVLRDRRFVFIKRIMSACPDAKIYVVGGAVRDALLHRDTKDYDFVVGGVPKTRLESLLKESGKVNLVGKKFGVFKFIPHGAPKDFEPIDIALPREEAPIMKSGHYRDFAIKSNASIAIDADLSRRDFTLNAMAYDVAKDELIDPFGGYTDLKEGVIRTVGIPQERFSEDYSRMLRAIRLSCQLDFAIEEITLSAIKEEMPHINKAVELEGELVRAVPYEVIAREMVRALMSHPVKAMDMLDDTDAISALIPEMLAMKDCPQPKEWHSEGDVWVHVRLALHSLRSKEFIKEFGADPIDALLIIAVMLHDIGKPYTLKTPERDGVDRIRFDGHDHEGARIARAIAERLRLASVNEQHIDADSLHWLINYHLILLNGEVSEMKNATIEKYFFSDPVRGDLLQKLIFVDSLATVRADGASSLGKFNELKTRIQKMVARGGLKRKLPAPILSGDDLKTYFRIHEGPQIGKLLLALREEQLSGLIRTKTQARAFIKKSLERK